MARVPDKDTNKLLRQCAKKGWKVERTGGGHVKLTHPNGASVYCGSTPSDSWGTKALKKRIQEIETCS